MKLSQLTSSLIRGQISSIQLLQAFHFIEVFICKCFECLTKLIVIFSIGYFGHSFWQKYNYLKTNEESDDNKDYINLEEYPFDYSVNEDSDDAITSVHKWQSSTTHLKLLGLAQTRRDPMISELAISAIASTQFDG